MASVSSPHFVIFPFMAKGHTIPLLHLSHLLIRRGIRITFFTTSLNSPFIRSSLSRHTSTTIIDLPFPENIPGLTVGIQSTDQLPSMSLLPLFATATILLQPHFERALETLPCVTCIVSDGFLGWTLESASKFNIPRLVSYGMSSYSITVRRAMVREYPDLGVTHMDEPLTLKSFPWIKITKDDLGPLNFERMGPSLWYEFVNEQVKATSNSWGILFNTCYEFESIYVDYWNREYKPRGFCLGPLCLAEPPRVEPLHKPIWLQWLDARLMGDEKRSVLYVAFGTQVEVSPEQLREIAIGLEHSEVDFLWVVRSSKGLEYLEKGFQEKVKDRGLVVSDWVDQTEILGHDSVNGFISHCGWNSVLESICAAVPILAWPMMADQFFNAKMVVEELGIGLRIFQASDYGAGGGFVNSESVEKMVRELMVGEKGKEVAKKVKMVGETAKRAMEEGGSSTRTLDLLIDEIKAFEF